MMVTILKTTHSGHLVYVEQEPITVARIPVQGPLLYQSVLVHPRYVPKNVEYEIVRVRGYRRGRSLDVLLDEPFEYQGKKYGIMNFKGVGRDTNGEELVIHPDGWFEEENRQGPPRNGERSPRMWGALRREEAREEFQDQVLPALGIEQIPYIAVNDIPQSVCRAIAEKHGAQSPPSLTQLMRLSETNIRVADLANSYTLGKPYLYPYLKLEDYQKEAHIDPYCLAARDATLVNTQKKLVSEYKHLDGGVNLNDNRFINGVFTDAENYEIKSLMDIAGVWDVANVIDVLVCGSVLLLCTDRTRPAYLERLSALTDIPFADAGVRLSYHRLVEPYFAEIARSVSNEVWLKSLSLNEQ